MFSNRDFPDCMTESAYIRERHGPPPVTPAQHAAWEAANRRLQGAIVAAYNETKSLPGVAKKFSDVSIYRDSANHRQSAL